MSIQHSHNLAIFTIRKRSLGQGNTFPGVCLSTKGLCIMSPDVWLPGPLFLLGESLSIGAGLCPGDQCPKRGLCPRGSLSAGISVHGGDLCPGGSLRGSLSKGALCPKGSVSKGLC